MVTYAKELLENLNFGEYGSTADVTQYYTAGIDSTAKSTADCISNVFKKTNTSASGKVAWSMAITATGTGRTYFRTPKDEYASKDAFKSAMAELGAYIIYELATPLTYTLSPDDPIPSLLGVNNVFCDTGNVAVEAWGF